MVGVVLEPALAFRMDARAAAVAPPNCGVTVFDLSVNRELFRMVVGAVEFLGAVVEFKSMRLRMISPKSSLDGVGSSRATPASLTAVCSKSSSSSSFLTAARRLLMTCINISDHGV